MSLSIEIRRIDGVVVLDLAGRLSLFEQNLWRFVWKLTQGGDRHFVINLSCVSYLDNSGLQQLCRIYTTVRQRGGDMKLLKPTPRIHKLLNITKLDTVFDAFDHEADALCAVQPFKSAHSA